jgi:FMN phosphatase YigB (HAD superfamily)
MIKAIFFDADGVTIHSRAVFFSQRFAVQQGISHEDILPFFKNDMHDALVGKVDIKEALQKYLPLWKWEGGVEDFLQHWFSEESPPNIEVLHYIQELRQR